MSAPSLAEVLRRLEGEGLAAAGLADPGSEAGARAAAVLAADEEEQAPWYLRLFILLGSWLGAFVAAFFLVVTDLLSTAPPAAVLGVLLLAAAAAAAHRLPPSTFAHQAIWILTLGGQMAVLVAVSHAVESGEAEAVFLTLALLQIPTLSLIPHPPLRLASAFTLVAAMTVWLVELGAPFGLDALAVVTAAAVTALWLAAHRLASLAGAVWRPLALGLTAGLLVPLVTLLWAAELGSRGSPLPSLPEAVTAALAVLALVAIGAALAEQGRRLVSPPALLAAAGVVAVAVLARDVSGLVAALLLGLLAHLRRDRLLEALALASLAFFLGFYYYHLDMPLLEKSLWVTATGVVVLLLAAVVGRFFAPGGDGDRRFDRFQVQPAQALRLAVALALAVGLVGVSVAGKERLLATGATVLLEMRPVDPRSLLQGDYMDLRYALDGQVVEVAPLDSIPRNGRLVLALDAEGVGRFVELWDGGELQPGEQLLRYRVRTRQWGGEELRLGAESFFFEEGTADLYQNAKFGELKVDEKGEAVLVGLRDAELRPLGERLH